MTPMTNQQIFDKVALHLLKQGKRAMSDWGNPNGLSCSYRGEDGTSCAVGCLIPDEHYVPAMEGAGGVYNNRLVRDALTRVGIDLMQSERLLSALQAMHDDARSVWKEDLRGIAFSFGLSAAVLQ